MWVNFIYWMRLFEPTQLFIRLIGDTMSDMVPFFILYLIILFMFTTAMYMINLNSVSLETEDLDEPKFGDYRFLDTLLNQYLSTFGEFSVGSNSTSGTTTGFNYACFISATLFINLIIFNILIAVMGDTYDKVFENKDKTIFRLRLSVLNDYAILFRS